MTGVFMNAVLKSALISVFVLALTPSAGAQNNCDRPNGSFDQVYCQMKVLTRADADLNVAYTLLLKKLAPAAQGRLRETQRAWLVRRDRDCVEYSASRGDVVYIDCAVDTTTERLNFLNDRLRECNSSGCQPSRLR